MWNKAGIPPQNVEDLGPEVWQPSGIMVLGTPIGSERYISGKLEERLAKERALWEAIPTVPDLRCARQILLQSANRTSNHTMRTMPPSSSAAYCVCAWCGHLAKVLLDVRPEGETQQLATLPMRVGGLGLRSAVRCAPAACWASWAGRTAHDQRTHSRCGKRRGAETPVKKSLRMDASGSCTPPAKRA